MKAVVGRAAAALGIFAGIAFLPTAVAHAGEASGCAATVTTLSQSGDTLGTAQFPGEGATQANPLPVDVNGSVTFSATTPAPYSSGTWEVSAAGVIVASGDFTNPDGLQEFTASDVSGEIPASVSSLVSEGSVVPVSVSVSSVDGTCTASGYLTGVTPATSSPILYTGAAFVLTGSTLTGALLLSKVLL